MLLVTNEVGNWPHRVVGDYAVAITSRKAVLRG